MTINEDGITMIKTFEGFRPDIYSDIVGVKTCGYGHKMLPTDNIVFPLTEESATALLLSDVQSAENYLSLNYPNLNANQFSALCDFAFNLGLGSLKTMLGHGLDQVATQIVRWDEAGGHVVGGLLRRRQAELALFQTPVTSSDVTTSLVSD